VLSECTHSGIVSYSARVSPHAEIGYELNGKSILAGDFVATPTTKDGLPRAVRIYRRSGRCYRESPDGLVRHLWATFIGVPQLFLTSYTDLGKCSDIVCTTPGTTHPDIAVRPNADYNNSFHLSGQLIARTTITLTLSSPPCEFASETRWSAVLCGSAAPRRALVSSASVTKRVNPSLQSNTTS